MQHVIATAGHVDHGKSTLVRALTGTDPDRWAEERRRGLTIDLGFAWTDLAPGTTVAFVDVPGHERFVPNMLAGVGPAPAALLVVAADGGWMPQTEEHVAALDALGVRSVVVAVSRVDLVDHAETTAVAADVRRRLETTCLSDHETVLVSGRTGAGLQELRSALIRLTDRMPPPDLDEPVRLWVDRSFTVKGAGTVVTGTLPGGRVRVGDELRVGARTVTVRGLESLGRPRDEVAGVARVALNLRGVGPDDVRRGDAVLAADGPWTSTDTVDVQTTLDDWARPGELTLHMGSAALSARVRPLGRGVVRLALPRALPLKAGDRGLLRDPGMHTVVAGLTVVDPRPLPLRRRGAAAARGAELADLDPGAELARRGLMAAGDVAALGLRLPADRLVDGWYVHPAHRDVLRVGLRRLVADHRAAHPLDDGPSIEAAARALDLPDRRLVAALAEPPLAVRGGRVVDLAGALPTYLDEALARLAAELADRPFAAPEAGRLAELGLGPAELAMAERAGRVVRLTGSIALLPGAVDVAVAALARLPQPFSVSDARTALGSSRRVVVPLLELLDRQGRTRRDGDLRHVAAVPLADGDG